MPSLPCNSPPPKTHTETNEEVKIDLRVPLVLDEEENNDYQNGDEDDAAVEVDLPIAISPEPDFLQQSMI